MSMTTTSPVTLDQTFSELIAKASEKGDIPAFSQSARSILNALTADAEGDFDLVQTVLADMALTQRVLRLANSAMYASFGGEVNSVSRAVQVLGVQTIAHLALGMKVMESLDRSRPETAGTMAEMRKAVWAGFLGRQLAGPKASLKDAETASVCSILMGLGRMLVAFYLPAHWADIERRVADGVPEDDAVQVALGGSFAEVGQRMGRQWGLPAVLTDALRVRVPALGESLQTHAEWLSVLATAATRSAAILHGQPDDLEAAFSEVVAVFGPALGVEPATMINAIRAAKRAAEEHFAGEPAALVLPVTESERAARLQRGFEELQTGAATATLSQLLILALEFLHTHFFAKRSFAFLFFAKEKQYRARFGLGDNVAALLPLLQFDSNAPADVFQAVLPKERALFIEDARAKNLVGKLPVWWISSLGSAKSFCLIPLHLKQASVGFLYLDWVEPALAPEMTGARMQMVSRVRDILIAKMSG